MRSELKHQINQMDYWVLRNRLKGFMKSDPNADEKGRYLIRSLYFDNVYDKALREKLDGLNHREKFRIRMYKEDDSYIRLEKKTKHGSLGDKDSTVLTRAQTQAIIDCDWEAMKAIDDPLVWELYSKMVSQGLRPKTIVQYTREPYIYAAGNVRVTFDYDLKTSIYGTDLLDFRTPMVTPPMGIDGRFILLEVKYDEFIPEVIKNLLQLGSRKDAAFSKYATCRMYG